MPKKSTEPEKVTDRRGAAPKGKFNCKNVIKRIALSGRPGRPAVQCPLRALFKDGLPAEAYAICEDEYDASTWQLPHHTCEIGRRPLDQTVDFALLDLASRLLSRWGDNGVRCHARPELIIMAARHLSDHYRAAKRQVPVSLCVLI